MQTCEGGRTDPDISTEVTSVSIATIEATVFNMPTGYKVSKR